MKTNLIYNNILDKRDLQKKNRAMSACVLLKGTLWWSRQTCPKIKRSDVSSFISLNLGVSEDDWK